MYVLALVSFILTMSGEPIAVHKVRYAQSFGTVQICMLTRDMLNAAMQTSHLAEVYVCLPNDSIEDTIKIYKERMKGKRT